jgi:hypothetical protein
MLIRAMLESIVNGKEVRAHATSLPLLRLDLLILTRNFSVSAFFKVDILMIPRLLYVEGVMY